MTNKYSCLLVDDEPPALEVLRTYVAAMPMLEIAGTCHHAVAAFEFLQKKDVDLIFLDIHMPRLLGTDLLKTLSSPPKVIFTTAYRDYAVEGFDLGAVDYLLKPYSFDRFLRAVHKVLQVEPRQPSPQPEPLITKSERFLYVRADRKMVKVMVDEIQYIESQKDYLRILVKDQQVITRQTITAIEEMLPEADFMRIHRSFIVSLSKIDSYTQHTVSVKKAALPVGPLYRQEVMRRLAQSVDQEGSH